MPVKRGRKRVQKTKIVRGKKYVVRRAYRRRGYTRKAYVRSTTHHRVKAAQVRSTRVKARLMPSQGLSRGKYEEIPLKDYRHLRTFGYHLAKTGISRHRALEKATKKYGRTWTVRRLNALRNVRPLRRKYKSAIVKLSRDIAYLESKHPAHRAYQPHGHAKSELHGRLPRYTRG